MRIRLTRSTAIKGTHLDADTVVEVGGESDTVSGNGVVTVSIKTGRWLLANQKAVEHKQAKQADKPEKQKA